LGRKRCGNVLQTKALPQARIAFWGRRTSVQSDYIVRLSLRLMTEVNEASPSVFIPNEYDGRKPVPLVLALHFAGRVTPYFGGEFLASFIRPALDGLGAIIVAPDCTDSDWTRPRSEKDVLELLDRVMKIYAIDRKRTLITGYSMGGSGTWYLAARHQDLFPAALIMAGQPESTTAKVNWKIPLYVIHSRADQIIPFKPAENAVEKLKKRGIDVQFVPLDGVTHYQVSGFFAPLEAAVAWIGKAWQK